MIGSKYECPYLLNWLTRMTLIQVKCHEPIPVRKKYSATVLLCRIQNSFNPIRKGTDISREVNNEKMNGRLLPWLEKLLLDIDVGFLRESPMQATCHISLNKVRFFYFYDYLEKIKLKRRKNNLITVFVCFLGINIFERCIFKKIYLYHC